MALWQLMHLELKFMQLMNLCPGEPIVFIIAYIYIYIYITEEILEEDYGALFV